VGLRGEMEGGATADGGLVGGRARSEHGCRPGSSGAGRARGPAKEADGGVSAMRQMRQW
jgi:hypothetical protein